MIKDVPNLLPEVRLICPVFKNNHHYEMEGVTGETADKANSACEELRVCWCHRVDSRRRQKEGPG